MGVWRRLISYRIGRLGKNTLLGIIGLGARAVIQAIYLLIVSRWLGIEGYGVFAGVIALVSLAGPLASWGSTLLLTQYIAQNPSRSRGMWATALIQIGVVGSTLICIILMIAILIFPYYLSLMLLFLLALAELLLLPAAHAATSQCYALERGGVSAIVMCLLPLGRTLIMLIFIVFGFVGTPDYAVIAHFFGSLIGLVVAIVVVAIIDGWPAWHSRLPLCSAIRQGTPYVVSNFAGNSYQEVDKVLILKILGAIAVGPYTVAFRIASIFLMPVTALIGASLPRLMAQAKSGGGAKTYRIMLISGISYGVLAGIGILIVSPWIPYIFGSDYILASHYLTLLAFWPSLFALRHCMATYLTANSRQVARSYVEIMGLSVIILLNILLLPRIGVEAAVLTLLGVEVLVAAVMALLVKQRERAVNIEKSDSSSFDIK